MEEGLEEEEVEEEGLEKEEEVVEEEWRRASGLERDPGSKPRLTPASESS